MDLNEYYLNNTYHILVRETQDQHSIEWFGRLTLSTDENGEIFVELSFDDQPVLQAQPDYACDHGMPGLSIECFVPETLCEPIQLANPGEY